MFNCVVNCLRVSTLVASFSLAACQGNFTSAPLCNDQNAISVPGLKGTYTISMQNEKFDVNTVEFHIRPEESDNSRLNLVGRNPQSSETTVFNGRLCQLGGRIVLQSSAGPNDDGYSYAVLTTGPANLMLQPAFFDRAELDEGGVNYEIIKQAPFIPKMGLNFETQSSSLRVLNDGVESAAVWKAARLMPAGLILNRK